MNTRRILSSVLLLFTIVVLLLWYARSDRQVSARPVGQSIVIPTPLGLPPVPFPADNPPTAETVALGRQLYYDTSLSADNTIACSTCHDPAFGFSDPKPVSEGVLKRTGTRNSPTVLNSVYFSSQFWDGRAASLEQQAEGPMQNPVEMAHSLRGVEQKLTQNPRYAEEFRKAFGNGPITIQRVVNAIAAFERTVVSGNSPFDRWYYGKDEKAVSDSVKRGFEVFRDPHKGNCQTCHTVNENYALFTDNKFHNIGVGATEDSVKDRGRFDVTKDPADTASFKTPTLRNVALTAPYFHDGSRKTLKEVLDFYIGGGNSNPHLDKEVHALDFLTAQERADLIAFMESLTGEMPKDVGPLPQHELTATQSGK
ncbi:MAG TPA: cytochrome c peroxidase [Terriglobales bacterium]|nr:cytochrome c peroxidase [Terriglobales bacterium]